MSKAIPATPSFVAWQKAASKLLTLETALAFQKRTVLTPLPLDMSIEEIETSLADARLVADGLFRIAFAESRQLPESRGRPVRTAKERCSRGEPRISDTA
ncbi:MAG: hypothetical protein K0Q43_1292 [Ramlibacter sp.]|jgi:hypothetical protein|nr:hypothetical protein [Ramlibacter sp.]